MRMIWIDADAAPKDVVTTVHRLAEELAFSVRTVSSINHMLTGDNHITVDASPQATDLRIINAITDALSTIVVTQDFGLAALVLVKGAFALSVKGMEYTKDNIDRLLFERALHQHIRKKGHRNTGPKARTKQDQEFFANTLQRMMVTILNQEKV